MQRPADLLWRLLPDVRAPERARFVFFAGLATLVSLAQTLGLTGAEALFLAEVGIEHLPLTIIGGSLSTVLAFVVYAARVGDARNDALFGQMLWGAGALLAAAALCIELEVPRVPIFLICFFFVAQAIFINHLWTFTADYFDIVASKRLVPLFTVGASIGGVVGGLIAAGVTEIAGSTGLIAGWALFLWAAAVLIRLARARLRGWGPIDVEESDETSVAGMRGALRYVGASRLGFALLASALAMILAVTVARFIWLDAFKLRFPDPSDLATFIGLFLAATNAIEIAIEMAVTPWLIRHIGVPATNLIHPALTLLSFAGLAHQYNIVSGALARMNGEMLENALANPVRALLCNAIPLRFRGRVRAFIEGVAVYAGMSIGGGVLWALGKPDPRWLALAGGAASLGYLAANLHVRREYLRSLVDGLRAGRLDLAEVGGEIGKWEASRLAALWEQLLQREAERPSPSLLKLTPMLAERGALQPLLRASAHPSAEVRLACVSALGSTGRGELAAALAPRLGDADARVRVAAIHAVAALGGEGALAAHAERLLADPDPIVRARAACYSADAGARVLEAMIASSDAAGRIAALSTAPPALRDAVQTRTRDPEPGVRAAALQRLADLSPGPALDLPAIREALADLDPRVRCAAVSLLANAEEKESLDLLAASLTDRSSDVRRAAESALAGRGDDAALAIEAYLRGESERTVCSALRVAAQLGDERSAELLQRELRACVHELWYWMIAHEQLPVADSLASRFLRAACLDRVCRSRRIAFFVLALIEDSSIVRNVAKALQLGRARHRGDALEILSHLGERESARLLVAYFEPGPLADRIQVARRSVSVADDAKSWLAEARESSSRWIRMGARAMDLPPERQSMEEMLMERLLALKEVPLFHNLSLDQLEAVHQIAKEVEFLPGEVILREGDRGDELYLLLQGRVRIYKSHGLPDQVERPEQSAVSYFGEMAVLDDGIRTATVVAAERSLLLCLDGNSLRELLMQMPEISLEMFRVLVERVRVAEADMRAS